MDLYPGSPPMRNWGTHGQSIFARLLDCRYLTKLHIDLPRLHYGSSRVIDSEPWDYWEYSGMDILRTFRGISLLELSGEDRIKNANGELVMVDINHPEAIGPILYLEFL